MFANKTYAFLNIFGLAIGIACAGLIFLWVEDEKSYDQAYEKKDQLYNVVIQQPMDGKIYTFSTNSTPKLLGPSLKSEIPDIANTSRFSWEFTQLFALGDKSLDQKGYYVDSSALSMFGFEFIEGSPQHALDETDNIIITDRMAERLFGQQKNVVGKILRVDNETNRRVAGVIKALPLNSTIQFDWLSSFESFPFKDRLSDWTSYSLNTYVELRKGADPKSVNSQIRDFIKKRTDQKAGSPELLAMNDWRLRSSFEEGKQVGGRIEYVKLFSLIAVIILVIACINFMNISTAKSEKRAREVGVRKVMGADRKMIMLQFMGEAVLMALFSVLVGLLIMYAVLPQFSLLVEKPISLGLDKPLHIFFLLAVAFICGIVAGSYPSLYLSSFNPVAVLKSMKIKTGGAAAVRKVLVVGQFAVSVILIISTIIIYKQIEHVKDRNLGYNKNNLLTADLRGDALQHYPVIKDDLMKTGMIENVASSDYNTIDFGNNTTSFQWSGKNPDQQILVSIRSVSPDFLPTTGMQLIGGRNFKSDVVSDSSNAIITESLEKLMGTGSAVGKYLTLPRRGGQQRLEVVGVIKDYVYGNMYGKSEPVVLFSDISNARNMYVKIKEQTNTKKALDALAAIMKRNNPAYPFTYRFVDDHFNEQFKTETLVGNLAKVFAMLAILISCLGLFGLSAYTAERKTKEIGIRKVLGADSVMIAAMLSKQFLKMIVVSCLVAFPVAWWMMYSWLQEYAYRININVGVFVLSAAIMLFIAFLTVSIQSIKAAVSNPIRSLRSE